MVAVLTAQVKAAVASKLTSQVRKQQGSASAPRSGDAGDCLETMPPQDLLLVRWFASPEDDRRSPLSMRPSNVA